MRIIVFAALCLTPCIVGQEAEKVELVSMALAAQDFDVVEIPKNKSVPVPDGRIVGGQVAKIEAFPYQISLSNGGKHACGGSIIRRRVVVTAAHCVKNKMIAFLTVRAGSSQHDIGGITAGVQRIVVHPNFNSFSMDNDIALVVLTKDLPFGANIQAVDFASPSDFVGFNTPLMVSGWGSTREGGMTSPVLRYVQVQLINQLVCSRSYRRGGGGTVNRNMMCAGIFRGGRDSCQGDSGGPLVGYSGGKPVLHGIVSWGYGCAKPRFPGVYTKVAFFNGWLRSNLGSLGYL